MKASSTAYRLLRRKLWPLLGTEDEVKNKSIEIEVTADMSQLEAEAKRMQDALLVVSMLRLNETVRALEDRVTELELDAGL